MTGPHARPPRRRLDGVLLLDKPQGITSQTAVTRVKRLFAAQKAGHTGTLDPMATGLLPIAFGEATKFSGTLLEAGKSYEATVRLGVRTTTGDLEGAVVETRDPPVLDAALLERVLERFRGEILQVPPMYSALKHDGRPLYAYARKGVEIERQARRVTLSELALRGFEGGDLSLHVSCSKGTYIRVLAEDIGAALGCGACLAALRRTAVGTLRIADAVTLDALESTPQDERDARLLPVDALLAELPALTVDEARARRVGQGMSVEAPDSGSEGLVRVYGAGGRFLGVAEAAAGRLQPRRMVAENAA